MMRRSAIDDLARARHAERGVWEGRSPSQTYPLQLAADITSGRSTLWLPAERLRSEIYRSRSPSRCVPPRKTTWWLSLVTSKPRVGSSKLGGPATIATGALLFGAGVLPSVAAAYSPYKS